MYAADRPGQAARYAVQALQEGPNMRSARLDHYRSQIAAAALSFATVDEPNWHRRWPDTEESMVRIGITGHMNLSPDTANLIKDAFATALSEEERTGQELVGVSCLAEGADAIFAQTILDTGGLLEALLPGPDYRDTRVSETHLPTFDVLVRQAHTVRYAADASSMDAYEAANAAMLDSVDVLWAVWDGEPSPAGKYGGTADAVAGAEARGVPVRRFWPAGATRS
ncbi:hypothetical protein AB0K52_12445 [Glycomyces sp. NPDC049804]|uniref:hypothetical protein n=1 Tax=Glycomyces sp. NPDC049804 TaxID=3154363 RepID=UPI00342E7044